MNSVVYLGHVFSKEGLKLDPNRGKAINEMPVPDSKESLLRFLGMTAYIAQFIIIISLAEKTSLL